MKKIKSNLQTAILTSKVCVSPSVSSLDPSNYFSIFGVRQSLFSVINPIFLKQSLKTSFLLIESFISNKFKLVIVTNIKNPILFLNFIIFVKKIKFFF